ncbi:hypothetical protein H0O02_02550, partial [Candidatus Micrarchaeota archaeon]|nr:hypothetical protein [Candidatus Micrarchaeota archaeon]
MAQKSELIAKIKNMRITPKGFASEAALLESIVNSCSGKRTIMLTGNYAVKEGPNITTGDPRLLGEDMFLTIELCARVHQKCAQQGIEPPALLLLPNDIVPGTFSCNAEERRFKEEFRLPEEISVLLRTSGMDCMPLYFFARDFSKTPKEINKELGAVRRQIRGGTEKLIVTFESFAQNVAGVALKRKFPDHPFEEIPSHGKRTIAYANIADTFSNEPLFSAVAVTITNPNGAPYCSFLAATLFHNLEKLGFQQMINTFVMEEYPCVDKA